MGSVTDDINFDGEELDIESIAQKKAEQFADSLFGGINTDKLVLNALALNAENGDSIAVAVMRGVKGFVPAQVALTVTVEEGEASLELSLPRAKALMQQTLAAIEAYEAEGDMTLEEAKEP